MAESTPPPDEGRPPLPPADEAETLDAGNYSPSSREVQKPVAGSSFARGQILAGRFRIVRFVARGGMGEVYEAMDTELNERVALKTVRFEMTDNERVMERFKREIQAGRKVTHASVCRTFDVFRHTDPENPERETLIVSMEFLSGQTLSQRIHADGRLTPEVALPIVKQMAAGLQAAHLAGVVHRDFKSPNVILVPSTDMPGGVRAVITDFGLAHTVTGNMASLTGSLDVVGTPAYMSPEQLQGKEVTASTDTYALGVVMYEMLTGKLPFAAASLISTALKRITEEAPSPRKIVQDIDAHWESVIMRCLERDPEQRFATSLDVAKALQGEEVVPSRVIAKPVPLANKYAIYAVATVLALASVLGYFALRKNKTPSPQASASPAVTASTSRLSVAILGFQNKSEAGKSALLGDVLTDSLWSQLDIEELRFIPPSVVDDMRKDFGLKEINQDVGKDELKRIGQYLGSEFIVTGFYRADPQQGSNQFDWTVRLIRVANNESVANIPGNGSQSNIAEMAARVGQLIRTKLGINLSPQEEARLNSSFSLNLDALNAFAEARDKLRNYELRAAVTLLAKSVRADAKFVQPHVALAGAWSELGFEKLAQDEAKKALELSGNMSAEAKGLVEGRYYETVHDWPKAMEKYASLWALYKDDPEYGLLLAKSQTSAGKASLALDTIADVRKLQLPLQLAARADLLEAEAQEGVSDFQKQLAAATAAAQKAEEMNAKLLLARARIIQCGALLNAGKASEAKPMCDQARAINRAQGDDLGTARSTNEVANAYFRSGDYATAKPLYEEALGKAQMIGDQRDEAGALINLANISDAQGDEAGAERGYLKSIEVAKARGSQGDLALAYQNLAVIQYSEGKRTAGAANFKLAINKAREIGDRKTEARALNNQCGILLTSGELKNAQASCDASLKIRRDLGDQGDVARSLGSNGDVQMARGDLNGAGRSYQEALQFEEALGQKHDAALTKLSLAYWALESGKQQDGIRFASDAAVQFAHEKDGESEAAAHVALAELLLGLGEASRSAGELQSAQKLAGSTPDSALNLRIELAQARIDAQSGKADAAVAALKSAELAARKSGDVALGLETRIALGNAQMKAGKTAQAATTLSSAAQEANAKGFTLLAKKATSAQAVASSKKS